MRHDPHIMIYKEHNILVYVSERGRAIPPTIFHRPREPICPPFFCYKTLRL